MKTKILILTACWSLLLPGIFSAGRDGLVPSAYGMSPLTEMNVFERVGVDQKQVSLLNLCDPHGIPEDWKALMAEQNIGEAPAVSSEKVVDPAQLRVYLTRFIDDHGADSSAVTLHLPSRIIVTRNSVQLTQDQIEDIFKKYIADNAPWSPHEINIRKIIFSGLPIIPTGAMTYEVVPVSMDHFMGNVSLTVNFSVNGEKVRTLNVSGKVDIYKEVVHAARSLKQNDIITASDIEFQRINITDEPDRYALRADQVVNKRLLRNITIHQAIDVKSLDKPMVLKRGDEVTIVYNKPGLQMTAKGQVKENAGVGDTVRVSSESSNKIIFCRAVDGRTVETGR